MLNRRFLSPTDQKCADSLTYWQFLYYRPPGKFRSFQQERSLKCDAKNLTYIYIIYIYHPLDNWYGFLSIGNTKNHVATLSCLEWLLKYVNISIILAPKLTSHPCTLQIWIWSSSYQFNISSILDCTTFHSFSVKKKLAGLWLAWRNGWSYWDLWI